MDSREEDDLQKLSDIRAGDPIAQEAEFEKNFPAKKFPGRLPIRSLQINFLERFNHFSISAENVLSTLEQRKIHSKIIVDIKSYVLTSPSCKKIDDQYYIFTSESFNAYLWCAVYCFMVHYEYTNQRHPFVKTIPDFLITDQMLDRSREIFSWGRSLSSSFTLWPTGYPSPNPTSMLCDSEALYCLYANHLSINAQVFYLYHELSHAVLKHFHSSESKRFEQDADNFAMDIMKDPHEDVTFFSAIFGIICALCSLLFLKKPPLALSSETHPDADIRILNARDRLIDKDNKYYEYISHFISIVFRMFSMTYLIESPDMLKGNKGFETSEESIDYYLRLFEKYKA